MNTKEAIDLLAKRGIKVDKIGKNQFKVWYARSGAPWPAWRSKKTTLRPDIYTEFVWDGRSLVKLASDYSSESSANSAIKGNVKKFDKAKNRSATRDKIQTEKFDDIPQQKKVKGDDIWSWD